MVRLAAVWAITGAVGCANLVPIDPTQLRTEAVRYLEWYCLDDSVTMRVRALEALSDASAAEGVERFRVFTPFMFEDGDHLSVILKRDNGRWILSDEGHTYMHLTYDIDEKDLQRGTRQKIITNVIAF